jgi:hypothetical protein
MSGLLIAGSHGVPTSAPLESFVATDYQRYDGLDDLAAIPDEIVQGSPSSPGGWQAGQHALPSSIPGKVGSVGATPLPVADAIHKPESEMATAYASTLTTQFKTGPGGAAPGLDQSLYLQSVVDNPVAPDQLAAIFA